MESRMDIPGALARFLYDSVRCGVVHHGMPKARLIYEVWTDDEWGIDDVFKENKAAVQMNVVKLAERYLQAVREVKFDRIEIPGLKRELSKGEKGFPEARRYVGIAATTYGQSSASPDIQN